MSTHFVNSSGQSGNSKAARSYHTIPASKPNNTSKVNSSLEFTSFRGGQTYNSFHQEQKSHLSAIPEDVRDNFYPSPAPNYQPEKSPPDLNLAIRHGTAHRVSPLKIIAGSVEICESTGVPFSSERLPLFCNTEELHHLGPVFPMYFLLIKQICYIAAFLCLITGAIWTRQFSEGSFSDLSSFLTNIMQNRLQMFILILGSLTTIFMSFFLLYKFRRDQRQIKFACKKGHTSSSNYTIMSSGLGTAFSEQEIKTFFSECILQDYSLNVKRVVKTYDVKQYIDEARELTILLKQKQESKKTTLMVDQKIQTINQFFKRRKVFLSKFQIIRKNDACFITFDTRKEAKVVRRRFELSPTQRFLLSIFRPFSSELNEYFFNEKFIKIEKAPEPNEIIWENLAEIGTSFWVHFVHVFICLMLFAVTAFGIYYTKEIQLPYSNWIPGIIIFLTNELLSASAFWMAQQRNYQTVTEKQISLIYQISSLQFLNMILPLCLLQIVIYKQFPTIPNISSIILIIGITCFGLPLLSQLLNLKHFSRVLSRLWIRLQGLKCTLTQDQANQKFEDPELDVAILYPNILRILFFSMIGFPFCPLIILVGSIALVLSYWIDKFNLLKRSLIPSYMRSELSEAVFETLDFALVILSVSILAFILFLETNQPSSHQDTKILIVSSLVAVVLTTIYFFLPNKRLSREYFPLKRKELSWSSHLFYQQAAEFFHADYHFSNPLLSRSIPLDYVKEKYHKTLQYFDYIEILQDCPEILPMFAYAKKFPSFYQIWRQNLTGLKNPFYLFPQNYGYGVNHPSIDSSGLKAPLLQASEQSPPTCKFKYKEDCSAITSSDGKHNENSSLMSSKNQDTKELISMIKDMSNILKEKMQSAPPSNEKKEKSPQQRSLLLKRHNDLPGFQNESTIKGRGDFLVDMESLTFGVSPFGANSFEHQNAFSHENSEKAKSSSILQNHKSHI